MEQVIFVFDKRPVQYLLNISYQTGVNMVKSWLIRHNISNWPINHLRKHFRAKWLQTCGNILWPHSDHFGKKVESLRPSCQKLTFGRIWPYLGIGTPAHWKRIFWMDWSLKLFFGDSLNPLQYFGVKDNPKISHRGQHGEILSFTP